MAFLATILSILYSTLCVPFTAEVSFQKDENTSAGLNFSLLSDSVWKIPDKNSVTEIPLSIVITNNTQNSVELELMDALQISIFNSNGIELPMDGGRDGNLANAQAAASVAAGESITLKRNAKLQWLPGQSLRLQGIDGFGGIWYVDNLTSGKYVLEVIYKPSKNKAASSAQSWNINTMNKKINLIN